MNSLYQPEHYKKNILIVDDDAIVRMGLTFYFDKRYYNLYQAENGLVALNIIKQHQGDIDLIITDWFMPELDGLGFLRQLKKDFPQKHFPIILQTNSNDQQSLIDAYNAGAALFLSKPIDPDTMGSIVERLLFTVEKEQETTNEFYLDNNKKHHFLQIRTLEEALKVKAILAEKFPDPESTAVGIQELLINAIEHGNLGIGYQEKGKLMRENRWLSEIERRLKKPENRHKRVTIELLESENDLQLTIEDEGEGFDPSPYWELSSDRMLDLNGRGITLSHRFSFDKMSYHEKGNKVTARKFKKAH